MYTFPQYKPDVISHLFGWIIKTTLFAGEIESDCTRNVGHNISFYRTAHLSCYARLPLRDGEMSRMRVVCFWVAIKHNVDRKVNRAGRELQKEVEWGKLIYMQSKTFGGQIKVVCSWTTEKVDNRECWNSTPIITNSLQEKNLIILSNIVWKDVCPQACNKPNFSGELTILSKKMSHSNEGWVFAVFHIFLVLIKSALTLICR